MDAQSLIRTIAGMHRPAGGTIRFRDVDITGWPSHRVCDLGIGQVAEGRQIFPSLSVLENLETGAMLPRARGARADNLARVYDLFPRLSERAQKAAGTLSGGEQQMLVVGRGLMARPKVLLLDEPSLGLAPIIVEYIFQVFQQLREAGTTILLVEQNVTAALEISPPGRYFMRATPSSAPFRKGILWSANIRIMDSL